MISFALVGCGRIADRHARLLASGSIEGARLAAVCDVDESKAASFAERFRVPSYTDYNVMMQSESSIDVVCVLTESGNHARHVLDLVKYGRDILVEKPMALRLEDADAMIQACAENAVRLFVVKQNRFNLPVQQLRRTLESGRFGKLILGAVRVRWCRPAEYYEQDEWRGTWALDGGVLANQASHHLDILEWMMGDVESVFAYARTALAPIEAEDTAVAVLEFRNGALGVIEATTATRPRDTEGSFSILGENGMVEIGGFALNEVKTWQFSQESEEDALASGLYSTNPPDVYGFGHKAYYEDVVAAITMRQPHLVDGIVGRRSLELINAIYESIETESKVSLRFRPQLCRLGEAPTNSERNHD